MKEVKNLINSYFNEIDSEFFKNFVDDFSFGKMLRSKLILTIAPKETLNIKLCGIIELIHFASLLHDDVIDSSYMRRGNISINAKHGDKNAIMLGDILYSKAFYEVSCISKDLSKIISNAVLMLSIGELEDVELSKSFNLDSNKYIKMINNKTASLIEAAAVCAGILSNKGINKYKIYGNSLGIAFQIIDDLLDITKETSTLGKESFSDLKEGKTTLPYIYLYNKMKDDEKNKLLSYFKKDLKQNDKTWIKEKIEKYNIINEIQNVALNYGKMALDTLDKEDYKLKEIIKDMIYREF
ncbi:polyprenyl synthetase family protein [Helicobacter sp. MIT 14-3879]|uniref:polyprenyl synthetase family protein n=1 Tax=Helicobacter sp. MIT 14-3879 TaxID=2040649 RepID=UPI000E1F495E|nr:octaprenyl-diphosphate synthase [Helicobacter sp. MIT 14-3879]